MVVVSPARRSLFWKNDVVVVEYNIVDDKKASVSGTNRTDDSSSGPTSSNSSRSSLDIILG